MGKKYKHVYDELCSMENLELAYKLTRKGKVYRNGHLKFEKMKHTNLLSIQTELLNMSYKIPSSNKFVLYEPKERIINVLPFRDRIVQHAIHNILRPIFEPSFIKHTYACRVNKGTHKLMKQVKTDIYNNSHNNKSLYYLKMDFSKYFNSIDLNILLNHIFKKVSDPRMRILLIEIVSQQSKGILIGNLLSQLFANIYGSIFDKFIKDKLKVKYYYRYMDDTLVLHHNKLYLHRLQKQLNKFCGIFMKLKFSKWYIINCNRSCNFVGYVINRNYIRVRQQNYLQFIRKTSNFKKLILTNKNQEILDKIKFKYYLFCRSWVSHVKHTNNKLYYNIFIKQINKL